MPIKVHFDENMTSFAVVPNGTYLCQVVRCWEQASVASGEPTLYFDLMIMDGDYAGQTLRNQCSLQAQALWKLQQTLAAIWGLAPNELVGDYEFSEEDCVGRNVWVVTQQRTFNDRLRSDVVTLMKVETEGQPAAAPPTDQQGVDPSEEPDI